MIFCNFLSKKVFYYSFELFKRDVASREGVKNVDFRATSFMDDPLWPKFLETKKKLVKFT